MAVTAVVVARMTSTATSARSPAYSYSPSAKQLIETVSPFTRALLFRLRESVGSWAGGWCVRTHRSAGRACRFQRGAVPPDGRYTVGRPFQNDSAEQTGLACSGLRTRRCRTRTHGQTGRRSPYSGVHPDRRVRLPVRFPLPRRRVAAHPH